jgi:hypothetical protein
MLNGFLECLEASGCPDSCWKVFLVTKTGLLILPDVDGRWQRLCLGYVRIDERAMKSWLSPAVEMPESCRLIQLASG